MAYSDISAIFLKDGAVVTYRCHSVATHDHFARIKRVTALTSYFFPSTYTGDKKLRINQIGLKRQNVERRKKSNYHLVTKCTYVS
jgi:hypothetical protein